jgi:hypothetical protein
MGGKLLGNDGLIKRGADLGSGLLELGFPPHAARVGDVVLPRDPWKQALPRPLPPGRRDGSLHQILVDACPPKIPQCGQRGQLALDLLQHIVPDGALLVPR